MQWAQRIYSVLDSTQHELDQTPQQLLTGPILSLRLFSDTIDLSVNLLPGNRHSFYNCIGLSEKNLVTIETIERLVKSAIHLVGSLSKSFDQLTTVIHKNVLNLAYLQADTIQGNISDRNNNEFTDEQQLTNTEFSTSHELHRVCQSQACVLHNWWLKQVHSQPSRASQLHKSWPIR